jgi:hypothetical protein
MTGKISEDPDRTPDGSEKIAAAAAGSNWGILLSTIAAWLASLPQTLTGKSISAGSNTISSLVTTNFAAGVIDADVTLAANSDLKIATQKAAKAYVDAHIGSGGVTPAALTRASDTNVTLTLGGTPSIALLQATSITVGWNGTLAPARGGFGADISAQSGVPLFASGVPTFTATNGTGNFVRATSPTLVTPNIGVATANNVNVTSSAIPANGMYLPASNVAGLSSNSTGMFQISQPGGLGRAGAFCFLLIATGGNVVAFRGPGTTGLAGAFDFCTSADIQCGSINIDQSAHTTTFNTSSDERGKTYRQPLALEDARDTICALQVWDHDDERNLIQGVGLLAQEAYSVLPRMVTQGDSNEGLELSSSTTELWMTDLSKAVPYLIAHCQLLQQEIDALKAQVTTEKVALQ